MFDISSVWLILVYTDGMSNTKSHVTEIMQRFCCIIHTLGVVGQTNEVEYNNVIPKGSNWE